MGGQGSGRKPNPLKQYLGEHKPNPSVVSNMNLPNYSGVKKYIDERNLYPTKAEWGQNGFPNTTDSSISFTDGTRLFSIQPTGDNFNYYIDGIKYKTTGDTLTIADITGIHIIY